MLDWLTRLRSRTPPLAKITFIKRLIQLRRLLEELAWTEQLPALIYLLSRDDIPPRIDICRGP
ncbi:MAG: hypothetical protein DMG57_11780 [Acidobacteria bacterium]|nr:MAG: hypothetical protein DMG57_11780 [Acidobacteriota bacterium]